MYVCSKCQTVPQRKVQIDRDLTFNTNRSEITNLDRISFRQRAQPQTATKRSHLFRRNAVTFFVSQPEAEVAGTAAFAVVILGAEVPARE